MKNTLLSLLILCGLAQAQTVPVQTTLLNPIAGKANSFHLASGTGVVAGSVLFIEREAMPVLLVNGAEVLVTRGGAQTNPVGHAAGVGVYAGPPSMFVTVDPTGKCSAPTGAMYINTALGNTSVCTSGSWVTTLYGSAGGGGSYTLPAATGSTLGGVKCGAGTTCAGDGTITPTTIGQVFESRPLKVYTVEPPDGSTTTVAPGASLTIMSYTGAGSLKSLQVAVAALSTMSDGNVATIDSTLDFTVEGVSLGSIPLGLLFATYGQQSKTGGSGACDGTTLSQTFGNENIALTDYQNCLNMGAFRTLYIPFTTSLVITYTNHSASSSVAVYSQALYYVGATPAGLYPPNYKHWHFSTNNFTASNYFTVAQYATITPLNSIAGPGQLDMIQMFTLAASQNSGSQPTWLEGNPCLIIDSSSLCYGGTEDFFGGQYYWLQFANTNKDWGLTYKGFDPWSSDYFIGFYRYFQREPVVFNTSLSFTWKNGQSGESSPPTVLVAFLAFWYTAS